MTLYLTRFNMTHMTLSPPPAPKSMLYLKARTHPQTLLANSLKTRFIRVCKQSANKYSVFLVSRWKCKERYSVCNCGRVSDHGISLSQAATKASVQNVNKRE
jgi:hypothetical protein